MVSVLPVILLAVCLIVVGAVLGKPTGWVVLSLAVLALLVAVIPHFPR
jgi:hypothetical protein